MDVNLKETSLYHSPQAYIDKRGDPVLIRLLSEKRHESLLDMYLAYQPRNSFNGLPPIEDGACVMWVRKMIDKAVNIVALSFDHGLIGHVALFPMTDGVCELLAVVTPKFQRVGVGTQLTRNAIQLSYELGFDRIWLCVETGNKTARHVYSKCGFQYLVFDPVDDMEMGVDLCSYYQAMSDEIGHLVNRDAVYIRNDMTCREAYAVCIKHKVGALPILNEDNEVVGILTSTDLITAANPEQKVLDVATMGVIVIDEHCSVSKVVRLFQARHLRCIPVVGRDQKLVGVIGRHEVLQHIGEGVWRDAVGKI